MTSTKQNIYMIQFYPGRDRHVIIDDYKNITQGELPIKIMNSDFRKDFFFPYLANLHKKKLRKRGRYKEILNDPDWSSATRKLYLEVLNKPEQIITDIEGYTYVRNNQKQYYYFGRESDSWIQLQIKRERLLYYQAD